MLTYILSFSVLKLLQSIGQIGVFDSCVQSPRLCVVESRSLQSILMRLVDLA